MKYYCIWDLVGDQPSFLAYAMAPLQLSQSVLLLYLSRFGWGSLELTDL